MARKKKGGDGPILLMPVSPVVSLDHPDPSTDVNILTKETLPDYQEEQLLGNARNLIPKMFEGFAKAITNGNLKAMEDVAQMYNFLPRSSGISVITNIQQNNTTVNESTGMYFEQIVRRLEQEQKTQTIDAEAVRP